MKANVIALMAFCALCWQFEVTNSRTSTLWRLNVDDGRITCRMQPEENDSVLLLAGAESGARYPNDNVYNIITSTLADGAIWSKHSPEKLLDGVGPAYEVVNMNSQVASSATHPVAPKKVLRTEERNALQLEDTLDCGKPVNFTYYDYLIGVAQRYNHPLVPEPEAVFAFTKTRDEKSFKSFDIAALERRLKRAKREKARSVHLYNQIGNYFRIVGNAGQAIECFRRALAMSPTNAEVLLNLARVLYNLQYLDDAIHLTRRSLEVQPPDRPAWKQYFTLGEIFKTYGHFQESVLHLRHALELHPQHEPIIKALRDMEGPPATPLHFYTIVIIVALVVAVLIVVISSAYSMNASINTSGSGGQIECEPKMQRHFNRALAMRSLKGFSSARSYKQKKY